MMCKARGPAGHADDPSLGCHVFVSVASSALEVRGGYFFR
jgi:hypothetical protein